MRDLSQRTVTVRDDNIDALRERYPDGLHFVVGDVHGETATLMKLMDKIHFDPAKDYVYFVGDYNSGGDVHVLLRYMSEYYQADYETPGFHMIRGNHERELGPVYPLRNLPDIIVIRRTNLNFYIVHAGMVSRAFQLINNDMENEPDRKTFAYRLEDDTCCRDAPLRQLVWSLRGLYSQKSRWHVWPSEKDLAAHRACIVHGHSPYCFFKYQDAYTYGSDNLFWADQHIWFCAELRSFNIDSNIKGRYENGESYRGLSCLCMEVYDELAGTQNGSLTTDMIRRAENGIFSMEWVYAPAIEINGNMDTILKAVPDMKTIRLDGRGVPVLAR